METTIATGIAKAHLNDTPIMPHTFTCEE